MARLVVAALIPVVVARTRTRSVVAGRWDMCGDRRALDDRETTVHRARVQLYRLGQTHGEPEREDAGETARHQVTTHDSNIR